jgi:hypothetical protein
MASAATKKHATGFIPKMNKTDNVDINVTLRSVRVTTVADGKVISIT